MIIFDQVQPSAVELEEELIGCLISNPSLIHDISQFLRPEHFFKPECLEIYKGILNLHAQGDRVDLLMVYQQLRKAGMEKEVGGRVYIMGLTDSITTTVNAENYARVIVEKWMLREQIRYSHELSVMAHEPDADPFVLFDKSNAFITNTVDQVSKGKEPSVADISEQRIIAFQKKREGQMIDTIPTHWEKLDERITGLGNSELIVVAGTPGSGKTTLVLQVLIENALRGVPVLFCSAEMTVNSVIDKIIFYLANVATYKMRAPTHLTDSEMKRLTEAGKKLKDLPIYIENCSGNTIEDVRAKFYRHHAKHEIKLWAYDFVQRARGLSKNDPDVKRISDFTTGFNNICKMNDIPGMLISQLNRSLAGNKKPSLNNLKGSGSLEEEADMVIFTYRPIMYGIREDADGFNTENLMRLVIGKFRQGEIQDVNLGWKGSYTRIVNDWEQDGQTGSTEGFNSGPF